jgi:hypothetical protein
MWKNVEAVGLAVIHEHDPGSPYFNVSCPISVPFGMECAAAVSVTHSLGMLHECGFVGPDDFQCWSTPNIVQSNEVVCGSL